MKNFALPLLGIALLDGLFWWMRPTPVPFVPAPTTPPTAAPAVSAPPVPAAPPVQSFELEVRDGRLLRGPAVLTVAQGSEVVLKITSDRKDELHLHGYDLTLALAVGTPAELRFTADRSGRFEYELHHAHLDLGALEVDPR